MSSIMETVDGLSDLEAVNLLRELYHGIYGQTDYQVIAGKASGADIGLEPLLELEDDVLERAVDSEDSVRTARAILGGFASDKQMEPLLAQALEKVRKDDSLFIGTVLTVGLLANLTIFMAVSEIEFKVGNLKVRKGRIDPEILKEILGPVKELIGRLPRMG